MFVCIVHSRVIPYMNVCMSLLSPHIFIHRQLVLQYFFSSIVRLYLCNPFDREREKWLWIYAQVTMGKEQQLRFITLRLLVASDWARHFLLMLFFIIYRIIHILNITHYITIKVRNGVIRCRGTFIFRWALWIWWLHRILSKKF